jgi:hypothetical protein
MLHIPLLLSCVNATEISFGHTQNPNQNSPFGYTVLCRGLEKLLSERHGHGMAWVNQTWPHCGNQMGKAQYKPVAAQ